jgi:hypothetical protein
MRWQKQVVAADVGVAVAADAVRVDVAAQAADVSVLAFVRLAGRSRATSRQRVADARRLAVAARADQFRFTGE